MAMDDAGNLVVCVLPDTGLFAPGFPITQRYDHYLFKFNPAGAPVWGAVYQPRGGTYSGLARVRDITLDEQSNIYMCGTFNNETQIGSQVVNTYRNNTINDAFLAKFDSAGNFQWVETYGDTTYGATAGNISTFKDRIFISGGGLRNSFVLGYELRAVGSQPFVIYVLALDSNRNLIWGVNSDSMYAGGGSRRYAMRNDHIGNTYLTSGFRDRRKWGDTTIYAGTSTNGKMELLKISPDGILDYALTNDGPGSPFDQGSALCIDEQGNVYVGGEFDRIIVFGGDTLDGLASSNTEIFVAKFGLPCAADSSLLSPVPPEDLSATATGTTSIQVTWQDRANFEAGFYLYRSSPDSLNWALIDSTAANVTGYIDTGLAPNTTYWYYAEAFNYVGMSTPTNIDSATTLPVIVNPMVDTPTDLVATAQGATSILIEWTDNATNETGYQVWCSNTGVGNWILVGGTQQDGTAYTDTGRVPNNTYWYRVRAYNTTDTSLYSNIDSATTFVVGITETTTLQAKLYPNPTTGTLTIELPGGQGGNIVLYNLLGQKVFHSPINGSQTTLNIDLPRGVYIYRIEAGGKVSNGKLMVE